MKAFATQHGFTNYTLQTRNEFREPQGILAFTKEVNADLIAMGTHGRRGLAAFLRRKHRRKSRQPFGLPHLDFLHPQIAG